MAISRSWVLEGLAQVSVMNTTEGLCDSMTRLNSVMCLIRDLAFSRAQSSGFSDGVRLLLKGLKGSCRMRHMS